MCLRFFFCFSFVVVVVAFRDRFECRMSTNKAIMTKMRNSKEKTQFRNIPNYVDEFNFKNTKNE